MTAYSRFSFWSSLRHDGRLTALTIALAAGLAAGATSAPVHAQAFATVPTPELQTPQQQSESAINQQVKGHHYDAALRAADAHIKKYPRDAQVRFTRARMLMELKRRPEAIDAFVALTQDFPELPEPYNNLAALYAEQGDFDKARDALEMAIRTHPNFAVAYANLGDVYAKLAQQAYLRAQQIAPTARVRDKAAQIDRMLAPQGAGASTTGATAVATSTKPAHSPNAAAKVESQHVKTPPATVGKDNSPKE